MIMNHMFIIVIRYPNFKDLVYVVPLNQAVEVVLASLVVFSL